MRISKTQLVEAVKNLAVSIEHVPEEAYPAMLERIQKVISAVKGPNIQQQIYEFGRTRMIQELRRALDADAGLAETATDIPDDIDDTLLWTKWLRS